ncbi:hypothetical protein HO173_012316 [Letharia columbiana]|uniref:Uncharacterized protein n=1 Tax=Letharia columbiana TaxID=112416 RepID=A0A8H6CNS2_9LECA|nr:uncharacterized protein HO173_012316 [Letharia columbiana]KAF6226812.1 hypothetical protein HO173_012316 [Letharia columbiana]
MRAIGPFWVGSRLLILTLFTKLYIFFIIANKMRNTPPYQDTCYQAQHTCFDKPGATYAPLTASKSFKSISLVVCSLTKSATGLTKWLRSAFVPTCTRKCLFPYGFPTASTIAFATSSGFESFGSTRMCPSKMRW